MGSREYYHPDEFSFYDIACAALVILIVMGIFTTGFVLLSWGGLL